MTIKDHLIDEYNTWLNQLGKRCQAIRKEHKLTQSKMAQKIGIDMKFYQDVEGGRRPVSTKTLYKMAKGFEISLEDLLNF